MTITTLRAQATAAIVITAVLLAAVVVAIEWAAQGSAGLATVIALVCTVALGAMFTLQRTGQSIRYMAVSVLMAEVMALVLALRGNELQIDMHMAFFAALALCALMLDAKAVLLAAALVIVHHIGLGLFMSSFVFYQGDVLLRDMLHAVILVGEAGALIWLASTTAKLMTSLAAETESVNAHAAMAADAQKLVEVGRVRSAESHAAMMGRLQERFGEVVDAAVAGDFSRRVASDFDDAELNALATGVNTLVDTVDRGLRETGDVLAALADTDLTPRMKGNYTGAFAKLKTDMNAVGDKLTEIMIKLRATSRGVRSATTEILEGANDLSARTTRQASTIAETSAAMEQLAATVAENATRAEAASVNADGVRKSAEEGGAVMNRANAAMEVITQSSAKISNIIGMIDDIAFQTNLLALNASVEAARAGDAGKGFAVVAVEVRRLAQSSAQASSDIKVLIQQSATEVSSGSRLVAEASDRLTTMLNGVGQNNAALLEMAGASRAQASAIKEITAAVRQMDEITQHNASLVEEINASIEQTEMQAGELDRVVEIFKIEETRQPVRTADAAPRVTARPAPVSARAKPAAKAYLSHGNAAIDTDWSEF